MYSIALTFSLRLEMSPRLLLYNILGKNPTTVKKNKEYQLNIKYYMTLNIPPSVLKTNFYMTLERFKRNKGGYEISTKSIFLCAWLSYRWTSLEGIFVTCNSLQTGIEEEAVFEACYAEAIHAI